MHCSLGCCSVLQCVAVCCSVLQCFAACCNVLLSDVVCCIWIHCSLVWLLQCVAVCCSVMRCVAVCCSVLQCVTVCCSVLQCVAVCCSVLQYAAACCSMSKYADECWRVLYLDALRVLYLDASATGLYVMWEYEVVLGVMEEEGWYGAWLKLQFDKHTDICLRSTRGTQWVRKSMSHELCEAGEERASRVGLSDSGIGLSRWLGVRLSTWLGVVRSAICWHEPPV